MEIRDTGRNGEKGKGEGEATRQNRIGNEIELEKRMKVERDIEGEWVGGKVGVSTRASGEKNIVAKYIWKKKIIEGEMKRWCDKGILDNIMVSGKCMKVEKRERMNSLRKCMNPDEREGRNYVQIM